MNLKIQNNKITKILIAIVITILLVLTIFNLRKNFSKSILKDEIEILKKDNENLIKKDLSRVRQLDSINIKISNLEQNNIELEQRYYYLRKNINNKIIQDEINIQNNNISNDSIRSFISKYKYKPFTRTIE